MQSTTINDDLLLTWVTELSDHPVSPELDDGDSFATGSFSSWNDELSADYDGKLEVDAGEERTSRH